MDRLLVQSQFCLSSALPLRSRLRRINPGIWPLHQPKNVAQCTGLHDLIIGPRWGLAGIAGRHDVPTLLHPIARGTRAQAHAQMNVARCVCCMLFVCTYSSIPLQQAILRIIVAVVVDDVVAGVFVP